MVKAPDLTNAQWQAAISDAEMGALIKSGRNRMPKFDLPDPVIAGLVAHVRSLREN
jgi:cytochrome c oxidase cbb3-type subunit 3